MLNLAEEKKNIRQRLSIISFDILINRDIDRENVRKQNKTI